MPTNDFQVSTDDYDWFEIQGQTVGAQPGTTVTEHGLDPRTFFPPSTIDPPPLPDNVSMMDKDDDINGPVNDFWSDYPITIDVSGYIFYHGENTGINVRGPAGSPTYVRFEDLTEEQKAEIRGADGRNGVNGQNGRDGQDGADGADAYQVWLADGHAGGTKEDFYQYIAELADLIIEEGSGEGSLILNYHNSSSLKSKAEGQGSLATGQATTASGTNSFTAGTGTSAVASNQFIIGAYNETSNDALFSVGNGTSIVRKNALNLNSSGDLTIEGEFTNGLGETLSQKVDKDGNKVLSTNDFTDDYKSFIDNYHVDESPDSTSHNPISNAAMVAAINSLQTYDDRTQVINENLDHDYPIPLIKSTSISRLDSTTKLDSINFDSAFFYNPFKNNFINNRFNSIEHNNILAIGNNLVSTFDNQILLGKYNDADSNINHLLQIGNGTSNANRSNALSLTVNGELQTSGDIINGDNVSLSQLNTRVNNIRTDLDGLLYIQDDTIATNVYKIGVDDGEFYIQLVEGE